MDSEGWEGNNNCQSFSDSQYEESCDVMSDKVTAKLAESGPIGLSAAAAIVSVKGKKVQKFETNPSIRKRQQTRLLRNLRKTIDEFIIRVGQQAVVLLATPGQPSSFKVFGSKPLEDVIGNLRGCIMDNLEAALAHLPHPVKDDSNLFELPPLNIDGIPTPVSKMTQGQLRAFIPIMLKYSLQRGKPGWGRISSKPPWWPDSVPWANIRLDSRNRHEKLKISWTNALREVVTSCYKYHKREDLLNIFSEDSMEITHAALSTRGCGNTFQQILQEAIKSDESVNAVRSVDNNISTVSLANGSIVGYLEGVVTNPSDQSNTVLICTTKGITEDGIPCDVLDANLLMGLANLKTNSKILLANEDKNVFATMCFTSSGTLYLSPVNQRPEADSVEAVTDTHRKFKEPLSVVNGSEDEAADSKVQVFSINNCMTEIVGDTTNKEEST